MSIVMAVPAFPVDQYGDLFQTGRADGEPESFVDYLIELVDYLVGGRWRGKRNPPPSTGCQGPVPGGRDRNRHP